MLANLKRRDVARSEASMSWNDYLSAITEFTFNGQRYLAPSSSITELTAMQGARNPIVAACMFVRLLVLSEAKFAFQRWQASRPGELFGTPALELLEAPWANAQSGDLWARMEVDASLYGNNYFIRERSALLNRDVLTRLDPCDVRILEGTMGNGRTELIGYGLVDSSGQTVDAWLPSEVSHYRPLPDPTHTFRGRSWLDSILADVTADTGLTKYKTQFLENAATPNLVVSFDPSVSPESFADFKATMDAKHGGVTKAFKTLYLGGGAKVTPVGANFEQLNLKNVQGGGESRIAAAAGVPAVIVGLSESMQGSSLNAGNYGSARRRLADGTIRPLWRSGCGALSTLVPAPTGARLWFDERDISFLQEDVMDGAEIKQKEAYTMEALVRTGFEPASAVEAIRTGDWSVLRHSGLVSVQLQTPGSAPTAAA